MLKIEKNHCLIVFIVIIVINLPTESINIRAASESVPTNIFVTAKRPIFYGGVMLENDLHFICYTDRWKVQSGIGPLLHLRAKNGAIVEETILDADFFHRGLAGLSHGTNSSFYFTYSELDKETPSGPYLLRLYSYYYSAQQDSYEKILLEDDLGIGDYSPKELDSLSRPSGALPIVIESSYELNQTKILLYDILGTNVSRKEFQLEGLSYFAVSSYFNTTNNCGYYLLASKSDEIDYFPLLCYNCTSRVFYWHSNCTLPGEEYVRGEFVYDKNTKSVFYIHRVIYLGIDSFLVCSFNTSSSVVSPLSVSSNEFDVLSYSLRHSSSPPTDYSFDLSCTNSSIRILCRTETSEPSVNKLSVFSYCIQNDSWLFAPLDLPEAYEPYYGQFIYNAASGSYADSYLLYYKAVNTPYRVFRTDSQLITSLGVYGSYALTISKPYLDYVIHKALYWFMILGPTFAGVLLGGAGVFYLVRFIKKKRRAKYPAIE